MATPNGAQQRQEIQAAQPVADHQQESRLDQLPREQLQLLSIHKLPTAGISPPHQATLPVLIVKGPDGNNIPLVSPYCIVKYGLQLDNVTTDKRYYRNAGIFEKEVVNPELAYVKYILTTNMTQVIAPRVRSLPFFEARGAFRRLRLYLEGKNIQGGLMGLLEQWEKACYKHLRLHGLTGQDEGGRGVKRGRDLQEGRGNGLSGAADQGVNNGHAHGHRNAGLQDGRNDGTVVKIGKSGRIMDADGVKNAGSSSKSDGKKDAGAGMNVSETGKSPGADAGRGDRSARKSDRKEDAGAAVNVSEAEQRPGADSRKGDRSARKGDRKRDDGAARHGSPGDRSAGRSAQEIDIIDLQEDSYTGGKSLAGGRESDKPAAKGRNKGDKHAGTAVDASLLKKKRDRSKVDSLDASDAPAKAENRLAAGVGQGASSKSKGKDSKKRKREALDSRPTSAADTSPSPAQVTSSQDHERHRKKSKRTAMSDVASGCTSTSTLPSSFLEDMPPSGGDRDPPAGDAALARTDSQPAMTACEKQIWDRVSICCEGQAQWLPSGKFAGEANINGTSPKWQDARALHVNTTSRPFIRSKLLPYHLSQSAPGASCKMRLPDLVGAKPTQPHHAWHGFHSWGYIKVASILQRCSGLQTARLPWDMLITDVLQSQGMHLTCLELVDVSSPGNTTMEFQAPGEWLRSWQTADLRRQRFIGVSIQSLKSCCNLRSLTLTVRWELLLSLERTKDLGKLTQLHSLSILLRPEEPVPVPPKLFHITSIQILHQSLESLTQLTQLTIHTCALSIPPTIWRLPQLEQFCWQCCAPPTTTNSSSGRVGIRSCTRLSSLALPFNRHCEFSLFRRLPFLETLDLDGHHVDTTAAGVLSSCAALTSLRVGHLDITKDFKGCLKNLLKLEVGALQCSKKLRKVCPNLQQLLVGFARGCSQPGCKRGHSSRMTLTSTISHSALSCIELPYHLLNKRAGWAALSCAPALRRLVVRVGFSTVSECTSNHNIPVRDKALKLLQVRRLKVQVDFRNRSQLRAAGDDVVFPIKDLLRACPRVKVVQLGGLEPHASYASESASLVVPGLMKLPATLCVRNKELKVCELDARLVVPWKDEATIVDCVVDQKAHKALLQDLLVGLRGSSSIRQVKLFPGEQDSFGSYWFHQEGSDMHGWMGKVQRQVRKAVKKLGAEWKDRVQLV